jgi:hypothetical protein
MCNCCTRIPRSDGGSKHFWNVGKLLVNYTAQYHMRQGDQILKTKKRDTFTNDV